MRSPNSAVAPVLKACIFVCASVLMSTILSLQSVWMLCLLCTYVCYYVYYLAHRPVLYSEEIHIFKQLSLPTHLPTAHVICSTNLHSIHTYIQNTFFADSRKLTVMWQYLR